MRLLGPTMVLATAISACHQDQERPASLAPLIRDSAGIRIIDNPRPPADLRLAWQIASEPVLTIGSAGGDPPYLFDDVRDAMRLTRGRIVVADGGSGELRVFDASGAHTSTWSRAGEGPGEFTSLAGVDPWPGDSLIACNARGEAISVFGPEGNLGRTFSIADHEPSAILGVVRGGAILTYREAPPEASRTAGGRRLVQPFRFEIRGPEGRTTGSLGVHPGRELYSSQIAGQAFMMSLPFSRTTAAASWSDLAVVAPSHRYEIRAYDADADLRRIVRRDHALIDSTPAHRDAHFLDLLRRQGIRPTTEADRDEALRESRRAFADLPIPETLPAFASLMADALDHLWVREFATPTEASSAPLWAVFDPDGRVLGYIETPRGLEIHEIGADYILARTTDDLGVEYVQLWPLSR